jgi:hypothetical protein
MTLNRRVTARFHKRARTASRTASPPDVSCGESDVHDRPVDETGSNLVARHAQISRPAHATAISLAACLRDARARAEEILREHPRFEGTTGATCEPCLAAYPCDAARAAEDVIAITSRLQLPRLVSSKALLELMTDLLDLGATDQAGQSGAETDPSQTPRVVRVW